MKLSKIFWLAANEYLPPKMTIDNQTAVGWGYSCWAILRAVERNVPSFFFKEYVQKSSAFMRDLGCRDDGWQFREFSEGPERQGARYAWLMFCSLYAEELGL